MTPAAMRVLGLLDAAGRAEDYDRAEIVVDGTAWVGYTQIHRSTVTELLRIMAVSDTGEGNGIERYRLNGTGRAILARPAIEDEIRAAMLAGGSFSIVDNKVVPLTEDPHA